MHRSTDEVLLDFADGLMGEILATGQHQPDLLLVAELASIAVAAAGGGASEMGQ